MEFIRNSEVKRQIVVSSILTLFWCGISIIVDSKAVWIVLSAIISSIKDTRKSLTLVCILIGYCMEMKRFLLNSFKRASCLFYMMKYQK